MTLKNGFGKCSLFFFPANGWQNQNNDSSFPGKENLNIWRSQCTIGQLCYGMTSTQSIVWFLESEVFGPQLFSPERHALLYPFDKLIKSIYFRSWSIIACENIRFSSLFASGDVSRGGTSATQRQKFHTDDVKYVQNPVRSPDWSME